ASLESPPDDEQHSGLDLEFAPAPEPAVARPGTVASSSACRSQPHYPMLGVYGHTMEGLTDVGIRPDLAQALESNLELWDSAVPLVALDAPGVTVAGVDALVRRTLMAAGEDIHTPGSSGQSAVASVVRERTSSVLGVTSQGAWQEAIDAQNDLPDFVTPSFMRAEYSLVVLSNRITSEGEYVKVRRPEL